MTETQHYYPQETHDNHDNFDGRELEDAPDTTIEAMVTQVNNRQLGGAALENSTENPALDSHTERHENDKPAGSIIELRFAGDKTVSIRPLSEYDVQSTKSKLLFPHELREYLQGREEVRSAKNKRTAELDTQRRIDDRNGYDTQTLQTIMRFLRDNPRGQNVLDQVGMESAEDMATLSIQDSIRLVGYVVASATSYDYDATKGRHNRADSLASLDILQRGLAADSQDDVEALGVCRNYADMTQSIFKSMRRINPNLRNTNCFSRGGIGSATDGQLLDKNELARPRAHAWNDFVTLLPGGEVAITTVDPTSARINDNGKLVRYDQTALRAGTHLRNVTKAFEGLDREERVRNAESVRDFYAKRLKTTVDAVRKKYPKAGDVPLNAHRSLQSLALEYAGCARQFGGDVVDMSKIPKSMRYLVEQAVGDDNVILSPSDFATATSVVWSHDARDARRRSELLGALEQKRRYAVDHNLAKLFRLNELNGEYPVYDIRSSL